MVPMNCNKFKEAMYIKTTLLADGLNVSKDIINYFPNYNYKKYHLYDHSTETSTFKIPDDIILLNETCIPNKPVISRVRYNSLSNWELKCNGESIILINKENKKNYDVSLPAKPNFNDLKINNTPIDNIVTKLGTDLCGVILSNSCFYYGSKKECKFCEILPTHIKHKSYSQATKKDIDVINAFTEAILSDDSFEFIVLTSGNVISYDYTCKKFIDIGFGLKEIKNKRKLDLTATLMPPSDFSYIDKLKESGFDKAYFDLEVYDQTLFEIIAPGKAEYGYNKLLEALKYAVDVFGEGSVYTNLIYGIQSLPHSLDTSKINYKFENEIAMEAVNKLLDYRIVPVFTVYHSSGKNEIGPIKLDKEAMFDFFIEYGKTVYNSNLIPPSRNSVIFSLGSISNTLYNDAYVLAMLENNNNKKI
jgi:hypothetical protein